MNRKNIRAIFLVVAVLSFATSASAEGNDALQGQKYFARYCASCHGVTGVGNGPVAKSLAKPPANLRLLADKYGLPLPAAKLADLIDGRDAVRAHGTRVMPVWGEKLYATGEGEQGEVSIGEVIRKIVAYLDTIQDHRHTMR
jgi:mono/diheme cytochrome c family protein